MFGGNNGCQCSYLACGAQGVTTAGVKLSKSEAASARHEVPPGHGQLGEVDALGGLGALGADRAGREGEHVDAGGLQLAVQGLAE